MSVKGKHPLELVLRHNGTAELLDAKDKTVWASDEDEDFREEFNDEFLNEDDIDDILSYLFYAEVITEQEAEAFESGEFESYEESLPADQVNDMDEERSSDESQE